MLLSRSQNQSVISGENSAVFTSHSIMKQHLFHGKFSLLWLVTSNHNSPAPLGFFWDAWAPTPSWARCHRRRVGRERRQSDADWVLSGHSYVGMDGPRRHSWWMYMGVSVMRVPLVIIHFERWDFPEQKPTIFEDPHLWKPPYVYIYIYICIYIYQLLWWVNLWL